MSPRPLFLTALLVLAGSAYADQAAVTLFGPAGTTQPWLSLEADPRTAALGGGMAVLGQGAASLVGSPGNMGSLSDPELSFAHNEWNTALGLREEDLGYGARVGDGVAAGSARYFSYGTFTDRDASGAVIGNSNDNAYAVSLGYEERALAEGLHLGGALTGGEESLSGQTTSLFTGSLGALYEGPWGLRAGLDAQDFKVSGGDGAAPTQWRLGLGWRQRRLGLLLGGEWDRPLDGDGTLSLGGEWVLAGAYSLRAGWRMAQGAVSQQNAGFSLGAGVRLGDLRLDYAYVPYGDFGATQRLGATLFMGEGLFGGGDIVIEAGSNSGEAQAQFSAGQAAIDRSDWLEAKVSLETALKLWAALPQADQARSLEAEADKHIAQEKARGGASGEMKVVLARKVAEARGLYQKGQLVEARRKLREVLTFDNALKAAEDLRAKINAAVADRVSRWKQQAVDALQAGDLTTAVVRYRDVLELDDSDAEARQNLVKLHSRVERQVIHLHRKGIDFYVDGQPDQAIEVWKQALLLDPADPTGIGKDMDRAVRLKQFKEGN